MTVARRPPSTSGSARRRWDEERLAALLLRLLGAYFVLCAIPLGMEGASYLLRGLTGTGLYDFIAWNEVMDLAPAAAELLIGVYCIIGGQLIFNRLLVPMGQFRDSIHNSRRQ
jgi:hypothetical protein